SPLTKEGIAVALLFLIQNGLSTIINKPNRQIIFRATITKNTIWYDSVAKRFKKIAKVGNNSINLRSKNGGERGI
ncbi:MAG: hypothetical protein RRY34_03495, partial [Victivallaceae bacterium]